MEWGNATVESFALVIPVRLLPERPVYLIISLPILAKPGFVAPTETFSNLAKFAVLATEIFPVDEAE